MAMVFRDAYYVCTLIWPWAHQNTKDHEIIEHYSGSGKTMNGVINLQQYKEAMSLE